MQNDQTEYPQSLEPTQSARSNPYELTSPYGDSEIPIPPPPPPAKKQAWRIIIPVLLVTLIVFATIAVGVIINASSSKPHTELSPTPSQPTVEVTTTPTSVPTSIGAVPYTATDVYSDFVKAGIHAIGPQPDDPTNWQCCSYAPEGGAIAFVAGSQDDWPMTIAVFKNNFEASVDADQIVQHTQTNGPAIILYQTGNCILRFSQYTPDSVVAPFEPVMLSVCI